MSQIVPTLKPGGDSRGDWRQTNTLALNQGAMDQRLGKALADIERLKRTRRGGAGGGAEVKMFKIQSTGHGDNHVQCKEWDGSAEVGSSLPVAKPTLLREGVKPDSHDDAHTITLPYSTGDIIFAVEPADGTGVSGVTWLDLNVDARMWGYELKFCDSGVAYRANFLCGTVQTA
jgi:hypothetical protein